MQEILDAMNGYSLRLSLPFLPPPTALRPTEREACLQVLARYLRPIPGEMRRMRSSSAVEKKRSPGISTYCGELVAKFMVSDDVIAVVAASGIGILNAGSHSGLELVRLTTPPKRGNEFSSVVAANVGSQSGSLFAACGLGVVQLSRSLRVEDDFESTGHSDACLSIDVSPDGDLLATGGRDSAVMVWSPDNGPLKYLVGHTDWVRHVKFVQCGRLKKLLLLSASDDSSVVVWDPLLGEQLVSVELTGGIRSFAAASDASVFAVASDAARPIQLFQVKQWTPSSTSSRPADSTTTNISDARRIPSRTASVDSHTSGGSSGGSLSTLFRLEATVAMQNPHRGSTLTAMCLSPNGEWLVTASEDETIALSSTTQQQTSWMCTSLVSKRRCMSFMNTIAGITILACPPSSSVIVTVSCSSDGDVFKWVVDPRDGRCSFEQRIQLQMGGLLGISALLQPLATSAGDDDTDVRSSRSGSRSSSSNDVDSSK